MNRITQFHSLRLILGVCLSIFFLLPALPACAQHVSAKSQSPTQTYKELQVALNKDIAENNIPGAVLSIKLPGQAIYSMTAGLSNLSTKKAVSEKTLFMIGSITKSFTAAIVLRLEEQGLLNINQTLSQVARPNTELSVLIKRYPLLRNITIRELLNHNSGVPASTNSKSFQKEFNKDPLKLWSREELLNLAFRDKPYFKAGTKGKYHYTNTDYMLAGLVVESVTGKSLYKSMKELFKQINLSDIYYPGPDHVTPQWVQSRLAHSYMPSNADWPKGWMKTFRKYPKVIIPGSTPLLAYDVSQLDLINYKISASSGGIITTAPNIVRWYQALFSGDVINSHSLKQMLDMIPTGQGFDYGLGITRRNLIRFKQVAISHDGSMFGFKSNAIYLKPSGIFIAITTNSQNSAVELDGPLMKAVLQVLQQRGSLHPAGRR